MRLLWEDMPPLVKAESSKDCSNTSTLSISPSQSVFRKKQGITFYIINSNCSFISFCKHDHSPSTQINREPIAPYSLDRLPCLHHHRSTPSSSTFDNHNHDEVLHHMHADM